MDTPCTEKEIEEFEEALKESFKSDCRESVISSQRRLLMGFYAMGRRHERNKEKGPGEVITSGDFTESERIT